MTSPEVLSGGGEMGALIRALDWSRTPVGPVETWPQSLRTAVSIILASKFPMYVAWGDSFTQFYNDGYRPILGSTKHPAAMGRSTRETFAEIWHIIGPMFDGVMHGEAVGVVDYLLPLDRNHFIEECLFTFSYSPIRDETGGVGGVLVTVTETTSRVLGERRMRVLREIAARTAKTTTAEEACATAASVLDPHDIPFAHIYLADRDGRISLSTKSGFDAVPAPDEAIAAVVRTGTAAILDGPFGENDDDIGRAQVSRAVALPIARPGEDRPAGVVVAGLSPRLLFDESYRGFLDLVADQIATAVANVRALQETRARAEALAELDRAKTAFFSNVSHEFRTPLTLLLAPLDDLLRHDLPDASHGLAGIAHRNALRLLKLVNTLLEFSRIEWGRIEAVYEAVSLSALTAELASAFRSAVERAGLRFEIDAPELDEPVYIDREMWEKVVFNLLSNALKFTFDGSIKVRVRRDGAQAVVEVADTGTGIPAAELTNVFTRFHRIRGARGRSEEGTGIGLALVQELVRLHGGAVSVESAEGKGSRFTIRVPFGHAHLPADRIQAARTRPSTAIRAEAFLDEAMQWMPVPEPPSPPREAVGSARILLADDNADMRDYVRRLLEQEGWDVVAAPDGRAALDAARSQSFDLVLSDIMMPGLDGFELLRELRAGPATRSLPVIFLSARAGEEARVEGVGAGADDYLVKPFSARELVARVRTHVKLARLRGEINERYRTILGSIADGFFFLDHEWNVAFANPQGLAITGKSAQELIGKNLWQIFPEAVGGRFYEAYHEAVREQKSTAVEEYYPPFGKWIEAITYPSSDGLAIIIRDVSARVQNTELLRERDRHQVAQLQMLTRASVAINSFLSLEQMLETIAQAARDLAGARDAVTRTGGAESQSSGPDTIAVPLRSRDGKTLGSIELSGKHEGTFNEQDEAILVQLAQLASVAIENAQLYEELQRANQAKDDFLATLSHELRTPMTSTLGWARLLRFPEIAPETLKLGLESIEQSTNAQARLIEDILDVSRISSGKLKIEFAEVDAATCVGAAAETVRPFANQKEVNLEVDLGERHTIVLGDASRLQQIVWNLLSNAVKFTPAGGTVSVRMSQRGGYAILEVSDTGEGIDASFLPHVFERFRQAESGSTRRYGGLGLGLAIARTLVDAHGGSIRAHSEGHGRGATFTVKLPLAVQSSRSHPVPAGALQPVALDDVSILLVEDQDSTRVMLTNVLRSLGADVVTASSVAEAEKALRAQRPDVVISDVAMPVDDGFSLIQRLRAREVGPRLPAIALTALASSDDRRRLLAAGFDAHVTKPVDPANLARAIHAVRRR